jgi:hypothetical protein
VYVGWGVRGWARVGQPYEGATDTLKGTRSRVRTPYTYGCRRRAGGGSMTGKGCADEIVGAHRRAIGRLDWP